jgi:hypothetical protein
MAAIHTQHWLAPRNSEHAVASIERSEPFTPGPTTIIDHGTQVAMSSNHPTAAPTEDLVPPLRKNRKRTKTGCLTCRKRRIKCGEERPTCANCIKSKRQCEGYNQRVVPGPANDPRAVRPLQYHTEDLPGTASAIHRASANNVGMPSPDFLVPEKTSPRVPRDRGFGSENAFRNRFPVASPTYEPCITAADPGYTVKSSAKPLGDQISKNDVIGHIRSPGGPSELGYSRYELYEMTDTNSKSYDSTVDSGYVSNGIRLHSPGTQGFDSSHHEYVYFGHVSPNINDNVGERWVETASDHDHPTTTMGMYSRTQLHIPSCTKYEHLPEPSSPSLGTDFGEASSSWTDMSDQGSMSPPEVNVLYPFRGPLSWRLVVRYYDRGKKHTGVKQRGNVADSTSRSSTSLDNGSFTAASKRCDGKRKKGLENLSGDDELRLTSRRRATTSSDNVDGKLLACPFCKNNPRRYRDCYKYVLRDISRLK